MKVIENQYVGLSSDVLSKDVVTAKNETAQFNFARHWRTKIVPYLNDPIINMVLGLGLKLGDPSYQPGDPPWLFGRGPINGQRAKPGCLSWYQPWGRCHSIAPFCWAIGTRLFPQLRWGFISCEAHTIVIGYETDWRQPRWVMDILLFKTFTADKSLAMAQREGTNFYDSLGRYVASFFDQPEQVYEQWQAASSIN